MSHRDEFRVFFEAEIDGLCRFAYRLTGNWNAAEDLAQDAMVRTLRAWKRIRAREHPGVYARACVVNLHRSLLRRALVAAKHSTPPEPPGAAPDEALIVWEALRELSPRQRAAIVLHYYEDLPQNEIADVLGCAPGTVNSLIFRGLARMRAQLAPEEQVARSEAL